MPRVTLSPELKEALADLNGKEKDKLMYRLLPKDPKLIAKLEYQLLEHSLTQEDRREDLRNDIMKIMSVYPQRYYSAGYLLLTLRDISGRITYHKDITGDKLGEVELNYLMLTDAIERNLNFLKQESYYSAKTFNEYVVKRIIKLFALSSKLHEDYLLEFEEYMLKLGRFLGDIPTMKNAIKEHNLDINCLLNAELPDN
jgi:hypothetical protein